MHTSFISIWLTLHSSSFVELAHYDHDLARRLEPLLDLYFDSKTETKAKNHQERGAIGTNIPRSKSFYDH